MKLRFYIDLWPGINPTARSLTAWTNPPVKASTARRVAFDVTIPDAAIFDIDMVAPEVSRSEVVAEREEA